MLSYKIALINVFWFEDDINNRFFETIDDQNLYFDNLTAGKFSPLVNFNINNNIDTAIIYRDESNREITELLKCNYAVINTYDNNNDIIDRRYYFAYPKQNSGMQLSVHLVLDDIQTNYIRYRETIAPCAIKRCNLDRFIDNGDGTVSFDSTPASKLFGGEELGNIGKRLIKRTPLNFEIDKTENSELNKWLKNNVIGWEYYYFATNSSGKETYKYNVLKTTTNEQAPIDLNPIDLTLNEAGQVSAESFNIGGPVLKNSLICIALPVYKDYSNEGSNNTICFKSGTKTINLTQYGLDEFKNMNDNSTRLYARKFSIIPPFIYSKYTIDTSYSIDPVYNKLLIKANSSELGFKRFECDALETGIKNKDNTDYYHGVLYCKIQTTSRGINAYTEDYNVDKPITFNKNEIIGSNTDPKFNPKFLSSQFFDLNLVIGTQSYTYDFQKLGKQKFKVGYNESLVPDLTKGYARIADTSGVYIAQCSENYTGLLYSNDNSLTVDNDKLSAMLAENKNYFLQQGINIGRGAIQAYASEKSTGAILNGVADILNTGLTLDNMRQAPEQIQNANGNVYFSGQVQPFKITIEEYDIFEAEKKSINDALCQYGFLYNQIDKITNYDNNRKYYNYIEANVDAILAPISNTEKQRLQDRLRSIRLWHTDNVDYTLENYERSLENE